MGPPCRAYSLCLRQPQVQDDNVNRVVQKMLLCLTDALHVRQFGVLRVLVVEHLAEQSRISEVIFAQEKHSDRFLAHPPCLCCGNLTFVSQKSLMLFTRFSNASSCTGLLREQFACSRTPF